MLYPKLPSEFVFKFGGIFLCPFFGQLSICSWRIWKEAEEKLLRECGVDEATIEQIRMADRADFNSNRRFYRWTNDVAEYLEDMAGRCPFSVGGFYEG